MKKILPVLFILSILLTGCTGYIKESSSGSAIPPVQEGFASTPSEIPLYFRYYDEPFLARLNTQLTTTQQQSIEYHAVKALLGGPSAQKPEFTACFPSSCSLVSLSTNNQFLYVTLSKEFVSNPLTDIELENRRLAVYSIVNTVCEIGNYTQVQVYVDTKGDGNGERLTRREMGFVGDGNETQPLGPLTRNIKITLTPSCAAQAALDCYSSRQWARLYKYLGDSASAKIKKPILEEFDQKLTYMNLIMSDAAADDNYTVSANGSAAMVQASFKVKSVSASRIVENIPLKLINENDCWKLDYEWFFNNLEAEN